MKIRLAANESEIDQAIDSYLINEPSVPPTERAAILEHWVMMFKNCPEGFWIAQNEEGKIVGVATSITLPPQWILANFYVLPAYHGMGIGKKLLGKAFSNAGNCERFLVHASLHPSAQSLYIQHGMYPLSYSIVFKGRPDPAALPEALTVVERPLNEILRTLNAFDQQTLGFTRQPYHQIWAQSGHYFLVKYDDQMIGYFCVSAKRMIGPLVVSDEQWVKPALEWAIVKQNELSSEPHTIFVPGFNKAAIKYLSARGYQLNEFVSLMSSHPMPGLAQVIFHDTDLL